MYNSIVQQNIENAEKMREDMRKEGIELQDKSNQEIKQFNEKISRLSAGILSISMTIYLGMYKELNSEIIHTLFFILWIVLLINLITFIFGKYFYSHYLASKAGYSIEHGQYISSEAIIINKKGMTVVDPESHVPLGEEYYQDIENKLISLKETLNNLDVSSNKYFNLYSYSQKISIGSFVLAMIILMILLWNISFNDKNKKKDISSFSHFEHTLIFNGRRY